MKSVLFDELQNNSMVILNLGNDGVFLGGYHAADAVAYAGALTGCVDKSFV